MDVRSKDSIRNIERIVESHSIALAEIKEDLEVLTRLVRDIKRSVVRKYGEKGE